MFANNTPTENRTSGIKWLRHVTLKSQSPASYLLSIHGIRGYNGHINKIETLNTDITYHKRVAVYLGCDRCVTKRLFTNQPCP